MIKYTLRCDECSHNFEGWFPGSKDYDKQKKAGHLLCPFCDSHHVDKAIMSPNIGKKSTQKKTVASTNSIDYSSKDIMMAGQAKSVLRKINKYVEIFLFINFLKIIKITKGINVHNIKYP